jgi:cell division transport system permease protein
MLKFKPGTILSIFSFSISLFILGFYLLILIHISKLVKIVNERTPYIIELKNGVSQDQIDSIKNELTQNPDIFDINYISKEKGLEIMKKELGQDILQDSINPLKDIIKLKLKNDFINAGKEKGLTENLLKNPSVENCYYEKQAISRLKKNLLTLNSVFLMLGIIFTIISFILIYNNLRFILHSDRFMIKSMELIGASPAFIKRPYIKLAILIGFYSGIIAILFLVLLLIFLNIKFNIFQSFLDINIVISIMMGIFVVSLIIPPVFINYLGDKYLRLSDRHRYR